MRRWLHDNPIRGTPSLSQFIATGQKLLAGARRLRRGLLIHRRYISPVDRKRVIIYIFFSWVTAVLSGLPVPCEISSGYLSLSPRARRRVLITRNREIDYRVDWYDVRGRWDSCSLFPHFLCIGSVHRGCRWGSSRLGLRENTYPAVTKIVTRYISWNEYYLLYPREYPMNTD